MLRVIGIAERATPDLSRRQVLRESRKWCHLYITLTQHVLGEQP
jgi:hypothetical protein